MDLGHLLRNYLRAGGTPDSKGWVSCRCPFHNDRTPSFGINVISAIANCYRCGSFSIKRVMERVGVPQHEQTAILATLPKRKKKRQGRLGDYDNIFGIREELGIEKAPLTFLPEAALNRMLPHRRLFYGIEDKFTDDTLEHFGVIYDPVEDRTCWPIRDELGRLVAISGRRNPSDPQIDRMGKYKIYKSELEGIAPYGYTPQNKECLFHYCDVYPSACMEEVDLILVEGFKAAAWVYQCGFSHVVALMGNKISIEQLVLLLRMRFSSIILFLDNNTAGHIGAYNNYRQLNEYHKVFFVEYPDDSGQPDDLEEDQVIEALQQPVTYLEWSMRRNVRRQLPPRAGGKDFMRISDMFQPKKLEAEGRSRTRVRLIAGEYNQELFDYGTNKVYEEQGLPYYFHTVYWPAYAAHPDIVPYTAMSWKGPLESTAGPDEVNPQPCVGRWLNDQTFVRQNGNTSRAASRRDMALVGLVELDWFHTIDRTSSSGRAYTELVRCKKDPITGRGRCEHCDASVHRQFGRRMYWDMRDFELNALLDYNEQSLATKGVCGCTVFISKFACSRCNEVLLDVEQVGMPDDEAFQWGGVPRTCDSCGHHDYATQLFDCNKMKDNGDIITNCNGVEPLSIWGTDLFIRLQKDANSDKDVLVFEAGGSGLLPSAPREVDNWEERWGELSQPWDFPAMVRSNRKSIQEQVEVTQLKPGHPFESLIMSSGSGTASSSSSASPARPMRSQPKPRTRVAYDGAQDHGDEDDDIPF